MTLTRACILFVSAVAVAVRVHPSLEAQDGAAPFWAEDRRPIAAIMLFNGTWSPAGSKAEDRYGLLACWQRGSSLPADEGCRGRGGVRWLMYEIERRHQRFGYRRFMLHLPAGRERAQQGQPLPSAQWHVLDSAGIETSSGSVRQDLQQQLTPWLAAHPDVEVLIYQGLRFDAFDGNFIPRAWLDRGNMDPEHATVPDLTITKHRLVVQQNTVGWLNLAPQPPFKRPSRRPQIGFAFDNTGVESTRDALVSVLDDPTLWGNSLRVFVGGEAIPHEPVGGACPSATLIDEYTARAPWFATMDVHQKFDRHQTWTAPEDTHLGFAVRNREYPLVIEQDGSCRVDKETAPPLSDDEVRASVRSAYDRGFVIIHYGGRHDAFIRDLYGLP